MTDLAPGNSTYLKPDYVKPTPFRTLPRTAEYILSRIGIVHIGDPPNQVVLPLSSYTIYMLYNPHDLQLNLLYWFITVESRLGVLLHLSLANRSLTKNGPLRTSIQCLGSIK
jgi:hypothetical protein